MRYKVVTSRGREFVYNEDDQIPYIDGTSLEIAYCGPLDCQDKMLAVHRPILSHHELSAVGDMDLTFDVGYVLGCMLKRTYKPERSDDPFFVYLDDESCRQHFSKLVVDIFAARVHNVNRMLGAVPMEVNRFVAAVESDLLRNFLSFFGIQPGEKLVPHYLKCLPNEFRDGILIGLLDSYGKIRKYRKIKRKKEYILIKIDEFERDRASQISTILDAIDINYHISYYDYLKLPHNLIIIDTHDIKRRYDLFARSKAEKNAEVIAIAKSEFDIINLAYNPAPYNKDVHKAIVKIHGGLRYFYKNYDYINYYYAKELIEQHKEEMAADGLLSKWSSFIHPNVRYETYRKPVAYNGP